MFLGQADNANSAASVPNPLSIAVRESADNARDSLATAAWVARRADRKPTIEEPVRNTITIAAAKLNLNNFSAADAFSSAAVRASRSRSSSVSLSRCSVSSFCASSRFCRSRSSSRRSMLALT